MSLSVEKMKKLRLNSGWSQERLAEISGLSLRTIQRIENGDNPSLESQLAIATAFNVSPVDLMNDHDIEVGSGGINWSGVVGVLLCVALMGLQFILGGAVYFDAVSILLVIGLPFAMSAISFGLDKTLTTIYLMRWVILLPKNETGLQNNLPYLKHYILYCHVARAVSALVGIIAVLMTADSYVYNFEPEAKNPLAMGIGIALLTVLYAAMLAELILRPLKHQIERLLITHRESL
ncbi:helix-turn-helix transcriptional regulator [Aliikangiella marina]|uniref:Helix-turn-helix transcriptional regulator n=1 Tax=Aliikangiella marina TaxID=1712262 RepID=A0A545T904_9GAMM|nr:helix-turn-helix transcriptional regulator [Aliikangiella marina]TQV73700.1 helix-turn-helix transcriptional regulator [Aliikangiella marina]